MNEKFIKITNSAYKVLEFLPEAEILKHKAKEKALAIMEGASLIFGEKEDIWMDIGCLSEINKVLGNIDIFLSYLEITKECGWIDTINFLILEKEYKRLEAEVIKLKEKYQIKNLKPQPPQLTGGQIVTSQTSNFEKIQNTISQKKELTERQKKILEIVQKNEKTQVADIIKVLPDVTKRTIRRDMDELLKSGQILRAGEFNQISYKYA
jgi:hypothetical protein